MLRVLCSCHLNVGQFCGKSILDKWICKFDWIENNFLCPAKILIDNTYSYMSPNYLFSLLNSFCIVTGTSLFHFPQMQPLRVLICADIAIFAISDLPQGTPYYNRTTYGMPWLFMRLIMDRGVLLTPTTDYIVSPRGETTQEGVDVNNTHLTMINPDYNMMPIFSVLIYQYSAY